jgi:hypothetical protein
MALQAAWGLSAPQMITATNLQNLYKISLDNYIDKVKNHVN